MLRDYQVEAISRTRDSLTRGSALLVLATGLGKTVVFAHLAAEYQRTLVLVHRDVLLMQAWHKIRQVTGIIPGIERGPECSRGERVVVASVQTLSQPGRTVRGGFDLIVADEAHHSVSPSWLSVLERFRGVPLLGCTATPVREDGVGLGHLYDEIPYRLELDKATDLGWLVPVTPRRVVIESLAPVGGEAMRNREGAWEQEEALHRIAAVTVNHLDRPTLLFAASVSHARMLSAMLSRSGYGAKSAFISGSTPRSERESILEGYTLREINPVCNVGVFTEGFDAPSTSAIVIARSIKSLPLLAQVVGRGTRPLPGLVDGLPDAKARVRAIQSSPKRDCLVLDFLCNPLERRPSVLDLLSGDAPVKGAPKPHEFHEMSLVDAEGDLVALWERTMKALETEEAIRRLNEERDTLASVAKYRLESIHSRGGTMDDLCSKAQASYLCGLYKEAGEFVPWKDVIRMTKGECGMEIGRLKGTMRSVRSVAPQSTGAT